MHHYGFVCEMASRKLKNNRRLAGRLAALEIQHLKEPFGIDSDLQDVAALIQSFDRPDMRSSKDSRIRAIRRINKIVSFMESVR